MTDHHPFFRLVWRLNGLAMLAVVILVAGFVGWQLARDVTRSRHPSYGTPAPTIATPVARPQDADQPSAPVLQLGQFVRAEGPVFLARLVEAGPGERYGLKSSQKSNERVRNVLFLDSRDGSIRRLFPDDRGRVLDEETVDRRSDSDQTRRVVARIFVHVPTDQNGDERLDARDRHRVMITRPDGTEPVALEEDVEAFDAEGVTTGPEGVLSYFVRRGPVLQYGEFDLVAFKPIRTIPVRMPAP